MLYLIIPSASLHDNLFHYYCFDIAMPPAARLPHGAALKKIQGSALSVATASPTIAAHCRPSAQMPNGDRAIAISDTAAIGRLLSYADSRLGY